jgi:hypothetical protein
MLGATDGERQDPMVPVVRHTPRAPRRSLRHGAWSIDREDQLPPIAAGRLSVDVGTTSYLLLPQPVKSVLDIGVGQSTGAPLQRGGPQGMDMPCLHPNTYQTALI